MSGKRVKITGDYSDANVIREWYDQDSGPRDQVVGSIIKLNDTPPTPMKFAETMKTLNDAKKREDEVAVIIEKVIQSNIVSANRNIELVRDAYNDEDKIEDLRNFDVKKYFYVRDMCDILQTRLNQMIVDGFAYYDFMNELMRMIYIFNLNIIKDPNNVEAKESLHFLIEIHRIIQEQYNAYCES